jgi:F0F1-type ATP synthase assembly protein I
MNESPDSQSPVAAAMAVASQITTVAAQMALPPLGGYWLDHWLGTGFVFVAIGAVLGLVAGMIAILRMGSGPAGGRRRSKDGAPPESPSDHHLPRR